MFKESRPKTDHLFPSLSRWESRGVKSQKALILVGSITRSSVCVLPEDAITFCLRALGLYF